MAANLSIIIKAIDQASSVIDGVGENLDGLEKKGGRLGAILKGGVALGATAAVVGIGALGAVLVSSTKEAMAAEEIQAQLNAVLASTGGVAGVTAEAINDHANELQGVTRYSNDAIVGSSALLLTFTKIGKETFPRATEAILDMSTAMGMDLQSATTMVGKALNDPIQGINAMSRAGIQFSEDQKETIKTMVEMGDIAGAQTIILAELEKQFGGSAEAAGQTMAGQMDILKNSLGDVQKEIGNALLPVLTDLVVQLGPAFVEGAQKFADWFVTKGLPALQEFGRFIQFQVYPVLDRFGKWFEVTILPHLINFAKFIIHDVIPALDRFGKWMDANVFPVLRTLAHLFATDVTNAINIAKATFEAIQSAIDGVVGRIRTAIEAIRDAIQALRDFLGLGSGVGTGRLGSLFTGRAGQPAAPSPAAVTGQSGRSAMGAPSGGWNFNITINAPGGNPQAVAQAAQTGVLAAARSMGLA